MEIIYAEIQGEVSWTSYLLLLTLTVYLFFRNVIILWWSHQYSRFPGFRKVEEISAVSAVLLLVRSPQCRVRGRAVVRRYGGFSAQSCSDTGPRHISSVPTPAPLTPSHLHPSRDTRDVRPSWRHQALCSLTVLCRSPHTLAILNGRDIEFDNIPYSQQSAKLPSSCQHCHCVDRSLCHHDLCQ